MAERVVGVVGGGIVGLAVGRELTQRYPGLRVVVFEKENRLGAHQTGHNSGVVHAGIYYKPGSLKADLCSRGRGLLKDYVAEHDIAYNECGKLVVAVDDSERHRFDALTKTATQNAVPGLVQVDAAGLREIEPNAAGIAALHSPHTAITDYAAICRTLGCEIEEAGGVVQTSTQVRGIARRGRIAVTTTNDSWHVDHLVLCPGLESDRVARLAGDGDEPRIVPFRGEYMAVRPNKRELVRGMIYPVPDPRYPFLGVHFTRRVNGDLEVGPNAVLALSRSLSGQHYPRSAFDAADVRSTLTWPGFWRMAGQHWRTGVVEVRGSLSTKAYMRRAQRYVPAIGATDVVRSGAGLRAQAVDRNGTLVDDFRISQSDNITAVRNAPSPAATSSLAIAEYVVKRIDIR
ncbi:MULTISPECIES: L-2-hydroxyglutarate oxidase [unclassified Nocardioides]|uniref:L-2-hydroxyglutarate oxidase n=1 Tax=unclassified Nocardioides TaxID=2615069 RepID=UPI0009F15254|nr:MULTISPECIES: L-2-hydroxyglutarate oxidase [unclassified Nocardioides]GAW47945.1 hydroxyglutarate oxidase [Nocardioides sp. PD653-B2]GAW53752.1 hydroxyglutarate oxidase [Nocardioides sp. PD653]